MKGETLLVRIPGLEFKNMVHRRGFILPLGDDVYRIGSTFDWTNVWTGRTVEAREELLGMLRAFVKLPIEVLEHSSGVRPATKDRRLEVFCWRRGAQCIWPSTYSKEKRSIPK